MGESTLKVLIADDEPLAAERLQLLLARIGGIDLVGTASDGEVRLKTLSAHNAQQIGHTLVCSYVKNDLGEESLQGQGLNRTVAFFRDAAN